MLERDFRDKMLSGPEYYEYGTFMKILEPTFYNTAVSRKICLIIILTE